MEHILPVCLLCSFVFLISVTSGQNNVCVRPELNGNIETEGLQRFYSPGVEQALSCQQGFTPVLGPRKIICLASGEWTKTKLLCIPKRCPYPDPLPNGELFYEDVIYRSIINYTCDEGYTLSGNSSAHCLASGEWSTPVPECKPVTCGLAPIPQFGMFVYDKIVTGNTTSFGTSGTYKCLPPNALIGEARAECTASGDWTETPECRVVSCPPPGNIDRGYMSSTDQRKFDFMETIKYGCHGDFALEGNIQIVCQADGTWSEKPSCKAPCTVDIGRGRILYRGQKIWIADLDPNRVLHKDTISVYCMDKARNCGYAVSSQCIDGKLKIPDCFEQPSAVNYKLYSSSLPSEIKQC